MQGNDAEPTSLKMLIERMGATERVVDRFLADDGGLVDGERQVGRCITWSTFQNTLRVTRMRSSLANHGMQRPSLLKRKKKRRGLTRPLDLRESAAACCAPNVFPEQRFACQATHWTRTDEYAWRESVPA